MTVTARIPMLFTALAALLALCRPALAQQDILAPDISRRDFYVECSGTINSKETFRHVRAQVTILHTATGEANPLLVVVTSEPAKAVRNSFYWDSKESAMEIAADTLRCRSGNVAVFKPDIHFFYMSPALYKITRVPPGLQESERIKWVDAHAKPTKIFAREAELTLRVTGNSVSGTVWMTGMDDIGHEPVRYVANFQGYEYVPQPTK